jgi:mannose-6-phosphate isomerase
MTLLRLTNAPRDYAWGSVDLIPDLLGKHPDGKPQAEIWFGTHPSSEATVGDEVAGPLSARVGQLGFLVKILAAAKPLSIQAHPTRDWAAKRFAEGHPGYADANHKPELIAAVSQFRALCGFRKVEQIAEDLSALVSADEIFNSWFSALGTEGLRGATSWALTQQPEVAQRLVEVAQRTSRPELVAEISAHFPGDAGLLVSLLLNYVELSSGEALYLPAGNIHTYLSGLGVEVMATSDNVLRGGMTTKQIDIPELLAIADFRELNDPVVHQQQLIQGLFEYQTGEKEFQVYRVEPSGSNLLVDLRLLGSAIAVCVAGEIIIATSRGESLALRPGEACFFAAANYFSVLGSGTGYLAFG